MDPYSGRVYELGADLTGSYNPGDVMPKADLAAALDRVQRAATADERAALDARRLVAVEAQAAHQLRLGQRELDRRARRRRGR